MTAHLDRACELLWQAGHPAIAEALQSEVEAALQTAEARVRSLEAALQRIAAGPTRDMVANGEMVPTAAIARLALHPSADASEEAQG